MSFRDIFRTAARSLRLNPLRAILSILGVIFGIASVIVLIAMGEGLRDQISSQVEGLGANLLSIKSGEPVSSEEGLSLSQLEQLSKPSLNSSVITLDDLETARENEYIKNAYPLIDLVYQMQASGKGGDKKTFAFVKGTDSHFAEMNELRMEQGEFLSEKSGKGRDGDAEGEGEVVLGSAVARSLFGSTDRDLIGEKVTVQYADASSGSPREMELEVVGVVAERPKMLVANPNLEAYIGIRDAQLLGGGGKDTVISINAEVKSKDQVEKAKSSLEKAIRKNHGGKQDFNIQTQEELMSVYNKFFDMLTAMIIGVAAISLVEGGIGVANIMYVSVKERTREIGVRLAQGASKKVVIQQFLMESVLLCLMGALIGVPLGIITSVVIDRFTVLPAKPTFIGVVVAFVAAIVVGVTAGVFPARQATRVEITEALRTE